MPVYTFPSTIYTGPVIINPFKADEIEITITPPGPNWRASLKLFVFSQNGLSAGHVSITLPRCTVLPGPIPAPITITPPAINPVPVGSKVGRTVTWSFQAVPVNSAHEFFVLFTPDAAGENLNAAFDVSAADLSSPVSQTLTFTS